MVFFALVPACRLGGAPTRTSPSSMYATTEGVVRAPSEFSMTLGAPFSITATQEFVVPRSIPMIFAMCSSLDTEMTLILQKLRYTADIGGNPSTFNGFRLGYGHQGR